MVLGERMKSTVETMQSDSVGVRSAWGVFADLVKARLTALVLLTTLSGFYLASANPMNWGLLFHILLGTGLLACGASVLNQYSERELDALMPRTQNRPLPSGLILPEKAFWFGVVLSITGVAYLLWKSNLLTTVLGALTLSLYLFVYTPLKRLTPWNTLIGAVPGALPPLMGWTAVRGTLDMGGWALFLILFLWQMPHFLAIAWMYQDQYESAGYCMMPKVDPQGVRTSRHALFFAVVLLLISLIPVLAHTSGWVYGVTALILGVGFIWRAWQFSANLDRSRARQLFFYSIIYLPLLLMALTFNKSEGAQHQGHAMQDSLLITE